MGFKAHPRYHLTRTHEGTRTELFLADAKGTITQWTGGLFGGTWSDGVPGAFTGPAATQLRDVLNAQLEGIDTTFKECFWHITPATHK
jgi:hypothetical protein